MNGQWCVYVILRCANLNRIYLELQSYGKILRETEDGTDVGEGREEIKVGGTHWQLQGKWHYCVSFVLNFNVLS